MTEDNEKRATQSVRIEVSFSLSKREKDELRKVADDCGVKPPIFIRRVVLLAAGGHLDIPLVIRRDVRPSQAYSYFSSEEENTMVKKAAAKHKMGRNEYIRRTVFGAIKNIDYWSELRSRIQQAD